MKLVRRFVNVILLLLAMEPLAAHAYGVFGPLYALGCLAVFWGVNRRPLFRKAPTEQIWLLSSGCELLRLFLITATVNTLWMGVQIALGLQGMLSLAPEMRELVAGPHWLATMLTSALVVSSIAILMEAVLFWNGMIRVYITSVQLGVKHRVLAALCGWIPGVNIWYLLKIIRIVSDEVEVETEKWELDEVRAESEICKTAYPLLLVHGVFFRDFRFLNYWGRIPKELKRNGATIYYGQQQSAASVEDSGRELAERIREMVDETGCEKVNILAHSKGGLDARAAITHGGAAPYVASLTTINTPHRGCVFAEYLLKKTPGKALEKIAETYNATLKKLGDASPDFLAAVTDLTESACLARNEQTPDAQGVLYESVMSYCKKAQSDRFPLNGTYPVVKHFDGENDGLVSIESARWGSSFTLLEPAGKRGISHGDMVDLYRENMTGFDVREFYVNLAADLKERGY